MGTSQPELINNRQHKLLPIEIEKGDKQMEAYKRTSMVVMLLCVMFSLFGVAGVANVSATYQLGPDPVGDSPSGPPYVFSNSAGGYSDKLEISPNPTAGWEWHVPIFTLTNTSTNSWAKITSFEFTIGDIDFNFDHLGVPPHDALGAFSTGLNNDGFYASSTPDNQNNAIRSDYILYSGFTGFDRGDGDVFTFIADIDLDGMVAPGSVENFRTVFWNNGEADNSEITVTFVPEPATLSLLGLGSLVMLRKRRA